MKVSKATKIQRMTGDKLCFWSKSDSGYHYQGQQCTVMIGQPTGSLRPINLDTLQADTLDDCNLYDIEPLRNFEPISNYPDIYIGENFVPALKRCLQIVSSDCARNYGTVVLITNDSKAVKTVATDSFILFEHTSETSYGATPFSMCLPVKACKLILELFGKKDVLLAQFSNDKTTLVLSSGNITCHVRVSSVKYPNYKPAMPDCNIGRSSGYWPKTFPKIKAIVADVTKDSTRFWAKGQTDLGTLTAPIYGFGKDFLPSRYNPKYLNFVTDSADKPIWYQSIDADNPLVFRSNPAMHCTETTVIVPITA